MAETHFRRGEVKVPHPEKTLVVEFKNFVAIGIEAFAPMFERVRIVKGKDLDIFHQQTTFFDGVQRFRKCRDMTVREDILLYKWWVGDIWFCTANRMQNENAVVF